MNDKMTNKEIALMLAPSLKKLFSTKSLLVSNDKPISLAAIQFEGGKFKTKADGPWNDEPDYLEFIEEESKLNCTISRSTSGFLRGFVLLPPGHPLWGKVKFGDESLDVHGSVTYSEECANGDWIVGFDAGHSRDLMPFHVDFQFEPIFKDSYVWKSSDPDFERMMNETKETYFKDEYRDIEYMKEECISLARQLNK